MAVSRRVFAGAAALLGSLALAACGSEDFENNPRPAAPIELSGLINDRIVKVSPQSANQVGAGLASIVISNQSRDTAALVLEGPVDAASDEIQPGGTGTLQVDLEQGSYVVTTDDPDRRDGRLNVGPPRPSAQNDLLLP